MHYASKTLENLDATRKAGLWGLSMPRRYGGLNVPNTVFSMASEIISAADAGFQNVWSLQSCIDTLYEFGNEDQRQRFIPRVCNGETMSMDLTEPDAQRLAARDAQGYAAERRHLEAERREEIHYQRRLRYTSGAGTL